jgi:YD repeat-containing protein
VLARARDPRYSGSGANIAYDFDPNTSVGFIRRERNGETNEIIAETSATGAHKPQEVYPGGRIVKYEYSNMNANLSKRTDGLGRVTTFTYDNGGAGHLASRTDAKGRVTTFVNTALGSLLSATHPDGRVENWVRDPRERPLSHAVSGPGIAPRTTTFDRDVKGRVTRVTHPDGLFEEWTYNIYGQPLTHRLRNGAVETMTYSPNGLLTESRDAANQPTTYTYDSLGRLDTVTDPRGNVTNYDFNDRGQVTKITWPGAGQGFVEFAYDAFGNRTRRTDEFGKQWLMEYDEYQRLVQETDPLGRVTNY